jgi:hypothetical protein
VIAGTGRAGTSFLVRYLTQLGLDTHLARDSKGSSWDHNANAGLEDLPFVDLNANLPYVIKSPWAYQCIDNLLASDTVAFDAVVIPVRDLAEAAASRCVTQQRAVHENAPWMSGLDKSWEEWAHVPGGIVFSVNPIDQGRLLAVGFHHLVQRLVAAEIPIIFLDFPRLTKDGSYLFNKLRPVLPESVDHETACWAHQRVADPTKVRIGAEIKAEASEGEAMSWRRLPTKKIMGYEPQETLDAIAVKREVRRLRQQLTEANSVAARAEEQMRQERATAITQDRARLDRIGEMETALAEAVAATERAEREKEERARALCLEADQCRQQVEGLKREMAQHCHDAERSLSQVQQEAGQLARRNQDLARRNQDLEIALAQVHSSRSWQLTRPYRAIGWNLNYLKGLLLSHSIGRRV